MKITKKPKAIIFDWDNTLVDTMDVIDHALASTFKDFNKELEIIKNEIYGHKSLKDIFPKIFGDKWKDASENFYKYYLQNHLELLQPLQDALQTLEYLSSQNIKISILSNKKGDILRKEVSHLKWNGYFQKILGSLDTKEDKPSPIPALHLLNEMDVNYASEVWFIGDSAVDMQCASNSGCIPIFLGDKNETYPYSASNHTELLKLLY